MSNLCKIFQSVTENTEMKLQVVFIYFALVSFSTAKNCDSSSSDPSKIKYKYILWIGDNVEETYSINLKSDDGIHFIDSMNQAAAQNPHFQFQFEQFSFGKFITEIAGVANNQTA